MHKVCFSQLCQGTDLEVNTQLYVRYFEGCRCSPVQCDTSEYLLWHVSEGYFVDYIYLLDHTNKWRASGIANSASWSSRKDTMKMYGISTLLSKDHFNKAAMGFRTRLRFEEENAFCCKEMHQRSTIFDRRW